MLYRSKTAIKITFPRNYQKIQKKFQLSKALSDIHNKGLSNKSSREDTLTHTDLRIQSILGITHTIFWLWNSAYSSKKNSAYNFSQAQEQRIQLEYCQFMNIIYSSSSQVMIAPTLLGSRAELGQLKFCQVRLREFSFFGMLLDFIFRFEV